jgi:hypothetical protein
VKGVFSDRVAFGINSNKLIIKVLICHDFSFDFLGACDKSTFIESANRLKDKFIIDAFKFMLFGKSTIVKDSVQGLKMKMLPNLRKPDS